jgi:hypothetical protein
MRLFFTLFVVCSLSGFSFSQLITNGNPLAWGINYVCPVDIRLKNLNNEALKIKYHKESIDKSYRFGEEISVNTDIRKSANKLVLSDGGILYSYRILSNEALSLNLIFNQFNLTKGSLLYVYASDKSSFTGAYSFLNNNSDHVLGTNVVKSNDVVVELYEPKENVGTSQLVLSTIVHGFIDVDSHFEKALGGSGSCNYDVNCPLGADFQDQKNGIGLTISGGLACSGSLVNNTSGTIIPYYLTARHCGTATSSWVLRFNWERSPLNAICAQTNSVANNGPTDHIITGTQLKASSNISDFTLVKLNATPDNSWNVFYNGWDNSDLETVTNVAVIHHPTQDIKKISKSVLAPYKYGLAFNGASNCQVWRVDSWTYGTTEQGSSGSPLFDQNKRIIGALTGGNASCSGMTPNTGYDCFGRFGYSWNTLADSAVQLKYWLDPNQTNATFIDGTYDNSAVLDLSLKNLPWLKSEICDVVNPYIIIFNTGNVQVTQAKLNYSFNGTVQTLNWNGVLNQYQSDTIYFNFPSLPDGNTTFNAEIVQVNNGADMNLANNTLTSIFNYSSSNEPVFIEFGYDFSTSEISWKLVEKNDPQTIIDQKSYSANGIYSPFMYSKCLPVGCYQLIIDDSYGDGWSNIDYGNGYLKIKNRNGSILAKIDSSAANFGSEITLDFCLTPLNVEKLTNKSSIEIFPNPSHSSVTIYADENNFIELIQIVDLNGKLIQSYPFIESQKVVLNHQLKAGIYIVKIQTNEGEVNRKIIVE